MPVIAIGGFLVGYMMGLRAGENALEELTESWKVIQASEEFQALAAGAAGYAGAWWDKYGAGEHGYGSTMSEMASQVVDLVQQRSGLRVVS